MSVVLSLAASTCFGIRRATCLKSDSTCAAKIGIHWQVHRLHAQAGSRSWNHEKTVALPAHSHQDAPIRLLSNMWAVSCLYSQTMPPRVCSKKRLLDLANMRDVQHTTSVKHLDVPDYAVTLLVSARVAPVAISSYWASRHWPGAEPIAQRQHLRQSRYR
jgi:hypothetical protein